MNPASLRPGGEDGGQLLAGVAGELDGYREPGGQAGVVRQVLADRGAGPGEDHYQVPAAVLGDQLLQGRWWPRGRGPRMRRRSRARR